MVGFCGRLHGAPMQMGPNPWRVRSGGVGGVLRPFAWGAHANGREPLTRSSGGVGPFRRPFAWGAHANGRRTVGAELTWGWPVPAAICMGRPCKRPLDPIVAQAPSFGPPSGGDYGGGTISHAWRPQRGRRIEDVWERLSRGGRPRDRPSPLGPPSARAASSSGLPRAPVTYLPSQCLTSALPVTYQ